MDVNTLAIINQGTRQAFHRYGLSYATSAIISYIILYIAKIISGLVLARAALMTIIMGGSSFPILKILIALLTIIMINLVSNILEILFNQGTNVTMIDACFDSSKVGPKQMCLGFLRLFKSKKLLIGTSMVSTLEVLLLAVWFLVPFIILFIPIIRLLVIPIFIGVLIVVAVKSYSYSLAVYLYYSSYEANQPIGYLQALADSAQCMSGYRMMLFDVDFESAVIFGAIFLISIVLFFVPFISLIMQIAYFGAFVFYRIMVSVTDYIIIQKDKQSLL